jgi:hypothetical protein
MNNIKVNDIEIINYSSKIIIKEYRNPSVTFEISIDEEELPIIIEALKQFIKVSK